MMTKMELAVRDLVAQELALEGWPEAALDKTLEQLGADSFDRLHLHMMLEKMLSIEFPWEDGEQMRTIGDIVSYMEARYRLA